MEDHVACVPATVDDLLQKFEKIAEDYYLHRIVLPAVQVAKHLEYQFIGFAFHRVQPIVLFLDFFQMRMVPKLPHHLKDHIGRLFQNFRLLVEEIGRQIGLRQNHPAGEFFDGFRNTIQRAGQRFEILPLQRSNKGLAKQRRYFPIDDLILLPREKFSKLKQSEGDLSSSIKVWTDFRTSSALDSKSWEKVFALLKKL